MSSTPLDAAPTLIDLFCGAGGLSGGLKQAGFNALVGVDFDPHALATYQANHLNAKALLADVTALSGKDLLTIAGTGEIDLVAGGPSCQGFSTHGKRKAEDPRNFLFREFVRIVDEVQPKFFLMENVRGLLTYSKGHFKQIIEESFSKIGYRVIFTSVCAADYGVPQMRHRIMFIGTRLRDVELSFPLPTHDDQSLYLNSYITFEDATSDLPRLGEKYNQQIWTYVSPPKNDYQRYVRQDSGETVTLHQANKLSRQAAEIAQLVGQGQGLRAIPTERLPARFRKMRRISTGELRKDCTTLYHRLDPYKPSYTITCFYRNIASGPFLHPWENRSLSHREAARLMSFPDNYEFKGCGIPRQIGNAVPPLLAAAVGRHLLQLLQGARRTVNRRAA